MNITNNSYKVLKLTHVNGPNYEVALMIPNGQIILLPVHEELVLKFRLVVGKELDEAQIKELNGKLDLGDAYQYALKLLSRRPYTILQVRTKLESREYTKQVIDEVLDRLINAGLLNDGEYVRAYTRQEVAKGKKGPDKIKQELIKRGISEPIIDQFLVIYEEDEQIDHALKIANRLLNANHKYGGHMLKQKIIQQLINKGFNQQIIDKVLEQVELENHKQAENSILVKEARKFYQKHQKLNNYERKTKVISALMRKGFQYEDILTVYNSLCEIE